MHADLLQQAQDLAQVDPRRPKQANLRRAVSSAYYGLFHYLVAKASQAVVGTAPERLGFRQATARAFEHGTMKAACKAFESGTWPAALKTPMSSVGSVPVPLQQICLTFKDLQDQRHSADYDLAQRFTRTDVLATVRQVETAIQGFESLSDLAWKQFFLLSLLIWKPMSNR
jgi:hypothetical protein